MCVSVDYRSSPKVSNLNGAHAHLTAFASARAMAEIWDWLLVGDDSERPQEDDADSVESDSCNEACGGVRYCKINVGGGIETIECKTGTKVRARWKGRWWYAVAGSHSHPSKCWKPRRKKRGAPSKAIAGETQSEDERLAAELEESTKRLSTLGLGSVEESTKIIARLEEENAGLCELLRAAAKKIQELEAAAKNVQDLSKVANASESWNCPEQYREMDMHALCL